MLSSRLVWETTLLVIGDILLICSQVGAKQQRERGSITWLDTEIVTATGFFCPHWAGSSSPPPLCLSIFFLLFPAFLCLNDWNICLKILKKKKFPERQKTKVSRGTVARFNWDLTSPFTHWGPLSLFYSAHGFLDSSSDTDWHKHRCTNRKTEKSKESSSPVDTGTLRQLLWMAEKQWSTFRPPVKRRCQAAGAGGCYHLHSASPLTRLSGEGLCFTGTQDLKTLCFPIYIYIRLRQTLEMSSN